MSESKPLLNTRDDDLEQSDMNSKIETASIARIGSKHAVHQAWTL